ncbi:BMP family lipoprotein [Eilatimonas milleporae]|uniref:Nucleoside-binding protein n=1 Tax=Eilatimonas milleporae TaxID=911205 RepID=A0A3M0D036_9PROT|nr:BMP family ABC transporter substrate-binding protein [Eilatimonas milleporae]RMB13059.1 nucleoside-binding protein [Eilatimonas milleporae]
MTARFCICICMLLMAAGLSGGIASARDFQPVLLYDIGGKFDSSFNEAAFRGADAFRAETGIAYREFEPTSETQYEQALKRFARRKADLIVSVGVGYAVAIRNVAHQFPDVRFTVLDAVIDLPNVQSITFRENEGSFLVGVIAGLKSQTGRIGFMGGMDIPLIRRFGRGFAEGARYVRPDIDMVENYIGTTPVAWNDPIRAAELALAQYTRGVDIIFAAAGPSGLGVIQAARDSGRFAIGVDSNQNGVAPGHVLTSMMKRVDLAVYDAMTEAHSDQWTAGHEIRGLREEGVGYALDEHNAALIPEAMRRRVEDIRARIISGDIIVGDTAGANVSH